MKEANLIGQAQHERLFGLPSLSSSIGLLASMWACDRYGSATGRRPDDAIAHPFSIALPRISSVTTNWRRCIGCRTISTGF